MLSLLTAQLLKRRPGFAQKVVSITTKASLKDVLYTKLSVVVILVQQKLAVRSWFGRHLMSSLVPGRRLL
jgi:hypothetical protein